MTLINLVAYREHLHRKREGLHETEFALAYAWLHERPFAPDTRPVSTAAPCTEVLDLHFDKKRVPLAIEMCSTCTIKDECLKTALDNEVKIGVWGGVHFG